LVGNINNLRDKSNTFFGRVDSRNPRGAVIADFLRYAGSRFQPAGCYRK
jgi:hypothetical protein